MSHVLPVQERCGDELTDRQIGDYQVGEVLAAGALTKVYRGLDRRRGREVAIKVLPMSSATTHPARVGRFRAEVQRLQRLRHSQVVPLDAYGEADGVLYLVMPLYPASLRDHLTRYGPLPPKQAVQVALQVASALRALHARGLLHRDVNPEHILLDERGDAYLAGLHAARELSELQDPNATWTRSSLGLPVGTPAYMAPEQLCGDPADQRVDVYGLGATLYELVTGRPPYVAETPWALAALALQQPITPPSVFASHIWPALERALLGALAREARERYPDMGSFQQALLHALGLMEVEMYEERWEEDADIMTEERTPSLFLPTPAPDVHAENRSGSSVAAPEPVSRSVVPRLIAPRIPHRGSHGASRWLGTTFALPVPLATAVKGKMRLACCAIRASAYRQFIQMRMIAMSSRTNTQAAWRPAQASSRDGRTDEQQGIILTESPGC